MSRALRLSVLPLERSSPARSTAHRRTGVRADRAANLSKDDPVGGDICVPSSVLRHPRIRSQAEVGRSGSAVPSARDCDSQARPLARPREEPEGRRGDPGATVSDLERSKAPERGRVSARRPPGSPRRFAPHMTGKGIANIRATSLGVTSARKISNRGRFPGAGAFVAALAERGRRGQRPRLQQPPESAPVRKISRKRLKRLISGAEMADRPASPRRQGSASDPRRSL